MLSLFKRKKKIEEVKSPQPEVTASEYSCSKEEHQLLVLLGGVLSINQHEDDADVVIIDFGDSREAEAAFELLFNIKGSRQDEYEDFYEESEEDFEEDDEEEDEDDDEKDRW